MLASEPADTQYAIKSQHTIVNLFKIGANSLAPRTRTMETQTK